MQAPKCSAEGEVGPAPFGMEPFWLEPFWLELGLEPLGLEPLGLVHGRFALVRLALEELVERRWHWSGPNEEADMKETQPMLVPLYAGVGPAVEEGLLTCV